MPTPFADPNLWNHATFTFTAVGDTTAIDRFGNQISTGKEIAVTFKMKKQGTERGLQQTEVGSDLSEIYSCKVVAVDGDFESFQLPTDIKPGDVGTGVFNDRSCKATIKSVAQSSLAPVLRKILGDNCTLEVDYRIRRGSSV
ncbi:MAG: hypothetical protein F6K41_02920 [Symploca sp. SIO3E6]|nr:hypothetical protein [Caldora sp. SIO3E6]